MALKTKQNGSRPSSSFRILRRSMAAILGFLVSFIFFAVMLSFVGYRCRRLFLDFVLFIWFLHFRFSLARIFAFVSARRRRRHHAPGLPRLGPLTHCPSVDPSHSGCLCLWRYFRFIYITKRKNRVARALARRRCCHRL